MVSTGMAADTVQVAGEQMLRLKGENELHKSGLRPAAGMVAPLDSPAAGQFPVGSVPSTNGGSGTVPCPVCGWQICSCLLQGREFLARVVGRRMMGKFGSPATGKGGARNDRITMSSPSRMSR